MMLITFGIHLYEICTKNNTTSRAKELGAIALPTFKN
jgi:hypothetical protein